MVILSISCFRSCKVVFQKSDKMNYVIVNGEIIRKTEANLTSFFWNEPQLFHHKIWYGFGGIPLFFENIQLIHQQLRLFGIEIPSLFNQQRELFRITKRMLNKNRFFRSGHITIHLFMQERKVDFVISCMAFPEFEFPFREQGLLLHFSEIQKYSGNVHQRFALYNQLIWETDKALSEDTVFQDSIFLNEDGVVCDADSANIFMIKDNTVFTPSPETGCYTDILRDYILSISSGLNFKIQESANVKKEDVYTMNELFLAGERNGFQWVMGIENKRFVRQKSLVIHQKFNEFLQNKVHQL